MNPCPKCGFAFGHPDKLPVEGIVTCPECGERYPVPWLPLFVITGAGGSGKTTVSDRLFGRLEECLILQADYLLQVRQTFDTWDEYWHFMILQCMSLQRNERPVVLEGWVNPSLIMNSHRIRFFSAVHILLLTCDAAAQTDRLEARNTRSRENGQPESEIGMALTAAQVMRKEAEDFDNVTVLDTTNLTLEQTVDAAERWVRERL